MIRPVYILEVLYIMIYHIFNILKMINIDYQPSILKIIVRIEEIYLQESHNKFKVCLAKIFIFFLFFFYFSNAEK